MPDTLLDQTNTPLLLPAPDDPSARGFELPIAVAGAEVVARVDTYSDRLRCDHPPVDDGAALGTALAEQARSESCGRVVVLANRLLAPGLQAVGYRHEATMPGFYAGEADCAVLGLAIDERRADPAAAAALHKVAALLREPPHERAHPSVTTVLATPDDSADIAELITQTFSCYPTPSGVPEYVGQCIEEGTPFRLIREQGDVIACASADLVTAAKTAELTDCATRPEHRGRGLMKSILQDLMDDLAERGYPTAFSLARARVPGMNLAFQRLGFELRGTMIRSCRIGTGLEDMNVWSRRLPAAEATN